ncbi:MAG: hypothetical protein ABL908_19915, partial [Hyphomicrobium sp.]
GSPRPGPLRNRLARGKEGTDSTYDWREVGEQVNATPGIPTHQKRYTSNILIFVKLKRGVMKIESEHTDIFSNITLVFYFN